VLHQGLEDSLALAQSPQHAPNLEHFDRQPAGRHSQSRGLGASNSSNQARARSKGWGVGASGDKVANLQDELEWAGFLDSEDKASGHGVFGSHTEAAVANFQAGTGLGVTGRADRGTRDAVRAHLIAKTASEAVPPPLRRGDEGPRVRRLQEGLVGAGLLPEPAFAAQAGVFSGKTAAAVSRFQRRADLPETGEVEAQTWRMLIDRLGVEVAGKGFAPGEVVTGDPELALGSEGPLVRSLERLLANWGADLKPDGKFEDDTEDALRSFQAANRLSVSGRLGPATAAALNSGRAAAIGGAEFDIEQGIDSLTYDQAVQMASDAGSPLFARAPFTVLAIRTGYRAVKGFEDHFVVLQKGGGMEIFAGSTRPDSYRQSGSWLPTMLLPGNYQLTPRHWALGPGNSTMREDAYIVRNQDGSMAVPTALNRNPDDVYDANEQAQAPYLDDEIRLHRGTNGVPASFGCLTVRDYDAFVEYLGGCNQPFDLCLIDLSEDARAGRAPEV
jgi:peptidoglycan hydrolase-like protein with peptidoglycan-binding domain